MTLTLPGDGFMASLPGVSEVRKGMKILIVEDLPTFADFLSRLIDPIRNAFPGSEVLVTHSLIEALEIISATPPPDTVLLDLTLPPHEPADTLERIKEVENRSPIVIVTGHSREYIDRLLGERKFEVVFKAEITRDRGVLFRAILKAVEAFCGEEKTRERYACLYGKIAELKRLAHGPAT